MKCKICNKEASDDGFCKSHLKAYETVKAKFNVWKRASGVDWTDYLVELQKNSLTGEWAKEVIKYLIEEEDQNVK